MSDIKDYEFTASDSLANTITKQEFVIREAKRDKAMHKGVIMFQEDVLAYLRLLQEITNDSEFINTEAN